MSSFKETMAPRSHHFQLPVATTVATVAFEVAAPGGGLFRVVGVVLVALSLMFTLHASERTSTRRNLSAAAIIVALLLGAYGSIVDDAEQIRGIGELMFAVPVLMVAVNVIRWIGRQPVVTGQSVLGGILVYLLVGLMFAQIYGGVGDLSSHDFFCHGGDGTQSDRLYFSFITITTTGYGDFTPCTQLGHALAMSEAMFGQVYLVTIIALLVGNLGRTRVGSRQAAETDDE